jgi:hypothetical protein
MWGFSCIDRRAMLDRGDEGVNWNLIEQKRILPTFSPVETLTLRVRIPLEV